jgi:hypothetical protein
VVVAIAVAVLPVDQYKHHDTVLHGSVPIRCAVGSEDVYMLHSMGSAFKMPV